MLKSGLPLDFINSLDEVEEMAFFIAMGEIDGGNWDWHRMRWERKDA